VQIGPKESIQTVTKQSVQITSATKSYSATNEEESYDMLYAYLKKQLKPEDEVKILMPPAKTTNNGLVPTPAVKLLYQKQSPNLPQDLSEKQATPNMPNLAQASVESSQNAISFISISSDSETTPHKVSVALPKRNVICVGDMANHNVYGSPIVHSVVDEESSPQSVFTGDKSQGEFNE
jgi:hypothetical protein